MRAGRLRHRISLQRNQVEQNPETGRPSYQWIEVTKLWAEVEPLSAREFVAASAVQSAVSARVTIRSRDINSAMRFVYRGKIYNIEGVLPDKDSGLEYITLPCSEGVNEG